MDVDEEWLREVARSKRLLAQQGKALLARSFNLFPVQWAEVEAEIAELEWQADEIEREINECES